MTAREYMAIKLKEFRNANHLSVEQVGEYVGKSGKTISAWEVGRGQPDADMLVLICRLYNVDISDFYFVGSDDEAQVLTPDEERLVSSYRHLNEHEREIVLNMVEWASQHSSGEMAEEQPSDAE